MADPLAFAEANVILYPPEGASDDVIPLHVRSLDGALVSCWQLSEEELQEVVRTRVVWLAVSGRDTQPPVLIAGRKSDVI